jgi:hypothetical protein
VLNGCTAAAAAIYQWLYNFEHGPAISPIFQSFLLALLVSSVATLIGL